MFCRLPLPSTQRPHPPLERPPLLRPGLRCENPHSSEAAAALRSSPTTLTQWVKGRPSPQEEETCRVRSALASPKWPCPKTPLLLAAWEEWPPPPLLEQGRSRPGETLPSALPNGDSSIGCGVWGKIREAPLTSPGRPLLGMPRLHPKENPYLGQWSQWGRFMLLLVALLDWPEQLPRQECARSPSHTLTGEEKMGASVAISPPQTNMIPP